MKPLRLTIRAEFGSVLGAQIRTFEIWTNSAEAAIRDTISANETWQSEVTTTLGEGHNTIDVTIEVSR